MKEHVLTLTTKSLCVSCFLDKNVGLHHRGIMNQALDTHVILVTRIKLYMRFADNKNILKNYQSYPLKHSDLKSHRNKRLKNLQTDGICAHQSEKSENQP